LNTGSPVLGLSLYQQLSQIFRGMKTIIKRDNIFAIMLPILRNVLLETKEKYHKMMTLRLPKKFSFYSKYIHFNFAILTLPVLNIAFRTPASNKAA
jgi:hypothetical protein